MEEYLAFIDEVGRTVDGNYLYRFDFTNEPDTVWGEYFNVAPSIIIPNLQPDENCINKSGRVEMEQHLNLAKKNGCFSMQDCFDHIISLGFTDIDDNNELIFNFGDTYEDVIEKLRKNNIELTNIEIKEKIGEKILDDLIDKIEDIEKTTVNDKFDFYKDLYKEILTIEIGQEISFNDINQILFDNGYEKVDFIYKKKQYTIRGHVVDIFSISYDYKYPVRISFFGNTVESIYTYDVDTQDKIEDLEKITIYNNI